MPTHYIKLQTLVNRERFTTQELKDLEYDINRARTDVGTIEKELFQQIQHAVEGYVPALRLLAGALAQLDALYGFATVAYNNQYVRPVFNSSQDIIITDGRHPVVAAQVGHQFIPNDTELTTNKSLWIITGPNMGGKSTYLRQVAIQIMALKQGRSCRLNAHNCQLLIVFLLVLALQIMWHRAKVLFW